MGEFITEQKWAEAFLRNKSINGEEEEYKIHRVFQL